MLHGHHTAEQRKNSIKIPAPFGAGILLFYGIVVDQLCVILPIFTSNGQGNVYLYKKVDLYSTVAYNDVKKNRCEG